MNEEKRIELYYKVQKLKENYELSTQSRINLVNELAELDDKIIELEEELEESKLNEEIVNNQKNKDKKQLKKAIKRSINCTLISIAIIAAMDLVMYRSLIILPGQSIMAILINTTANMLTYYCFRPERKESKSRSVGEIEKEYEEVLNKRLIKGGEYKKVRYTEVVNEQIYKYSKNLLDDITKNNKTSSHEDNLVSTNDIYWKIKLDKPFTIETIEEKIKILDDKLIEYLQQKVSESYNETILPRYLEIFSANELIEILSRQIPEKEHNEKLKHIIHAILGLIATIQGYSVMWSEENDEKLIQHPEIEYDQEGRCVELKTHNNTDYIMLFDIIYDEFININIRKTKIKTKKK